MNRKKYIIKHSFFNITYLHAVLRIRIYFDPYHLSVSVLSSGSGSVYIWYYIYGTVYGIYGT